MVRRVISDAFARNRPLAWATVAHAMLIVFLIPAAMIDPTELLGVSRWIKPLKFAISVPIFLATMIWLLSYLPRSGVRTVISYAIAGSMTTEMILIMVQATRGVQSHFNHETDFDGAVFSAMGMLIMVNTAAVIHTILLFFTRTTTIHGAHLAGVRLGLIIFVAASLEGGLMVARDAHTVGIHDGGPGLPIVNWSTGAGDLRVAHFAGLHALQGLPILGWMFDRSGARNGWFWVAGAAVLWAVVTTLLVIQALNGQPLIPLVT